MNRYIGQPDYVHGSEPRMGVLLTNLGTPNAPTTGALRRYLKEFLSDPRVIETPRLPWWFILNGIILNTRPQKSARSYRKIWTEEGSPLMRISLKQQQALQRALEEKFGGPVKVALAMRYGDPSIRSGLEELRSAGIRRLLVLPLYPQYSAATNASTFDAVSKVLQRWRWLPDFRFISHYHDEPGYIDALAQRIRAHWDNEGRADKLLFTFHGIPKHYFTAGDPYHCECHATARLLAEKLGLPESQWQVSFQSRFGPREWLRPYTDEVLAAMPGQGVKSVQVVCPGFSADCLETLEEMNIQNRELFMQAGGDRFTYIPALNDQPAHIDFLADLVAKHAQGWPEVRPDYDRETVSREQANARQRALAMGSER
ncbi:ferrochelatase [Methylohalomonas lacus]|uniref:Ferrochelatase n=1 Tax=Methylohalomonas lacus TaxID=398773 RepID=A0AAE3HKC1_9GAMM|nr:ferrochelatase [Methylohalomonas lacus]MCS3903365.1 ferrochelatase [Methylohalomonas lacus]